MRQQSIVFWALCALVWVPTPSLSGLTNSGASPDQNSMDCNIPELHGRWVLVTANPQGDAGGDQLTFMTPNNANPQKSCEISPERTAWKTFGNIVGYWDYLVIVESGTGPDLRDLEIGDLVQKKTVYHVTYSAGGRHLRVGKDGTVRFSVPKDELAKSMNCQPEDGLGAGANVEMVYDLRTMEAMPTGKRTCAHRQ